MKIGAVRKEIEEVLDTYRDRLDTIPDDQFDLTPRDGSWSYAEVYSHILQADISSTIALEKSTLANCVKTSKGRSLSGLFVFSFGTFPKVKVPKEVSAIIPANKISKENARNLIVKCRKRIDTARQWFKFILIHSKHHLKQLDRIEKKVIHLMKPFLFNSVLTFR